MLLRACRQVSTNPPRPIARTGKDPELDRGGIMSRYDDRYDTYEYYRRKDEFYRQQDLRHEHFKEDLRWEREVSARRSELGRKAAREGNMPWAFHWMGATDQAIELARQREKPAYRPGKAERRLKTLLDSAMRNLDLGAFAQAEKEFSRIIDAVPEFAPAYIHRATCRYCRKKFSGAVEDCHAALRLEPGRAILHFRRGRAYAGLGRMEEAVADYNQAIELDPEYAPALDSRGLHRMRSRRFEDAVADFSRVIRLSPEKTAVYLDRGNCRHYLRQYHSAIEDFSASIRLKPTLMPAYLGRGRCYQAIGKLKAALPDFDRAIELAPALDDAYRARGNCRLQAGNLPGALTDFNRAIELNPSYDLNYYERGLYHLKQQNPIKAGVDLEECIRLNPEWGTAYMVRGDCYLQKKDFKRALRAYEKAKELYKKDGNEKMMQIAGKACRKVLAGQ